MSLTPKRQQRLTRLIELLIATVVVIAALSLWQWYQAGGGFEVVYVVLGVVLAGLWAARHWLKRESPSEANRLTSWEQALATGDDGLTALRRQIEQAFNLDDLRTLVFDLNIHYDNLAGETLERKIISLLEMCQTQGRWSDLMQNLQSARPHVQWAKVTVGGGITTPQAQRNRENLLNQVQTAWIDGVLKQSIHSEVIKLGLSYRPEAVGQRPWQLVLQQAGQPDKPVPAERSLLDLFVASGRNLLILGEPGSGKTITLLQLTERLIEIAREENAPLPIILNLSSWAREQKPLADWMVEEIFVQYGVARDLTRAAIAQNQFVYLLDGLDEVSDEVRDVCLEAINRFKENHPAEMVVCSRIKEYEALRERLHLGMALQIQPLTDVQVDDYLRQEGLELQAVRATLVQDAELRELAHTPLMLSLMTLAYRGMTKEALRPLADKEARRRHLFSHYVQRMFTHRPLPRDNPYTQTQALGWLANLACGMVQHDQSTFYIEYLQSTWLGNVYLRRQHRLIHGLYRGLALAPFSALLIGWLLVTATDMEIVSGLSIGLAVGLIIGLLSEWYAQWSDYPIVLIEEISWHWPTVQELRQGIQATREDVTKYLFRVLRAFAIVVAMGLILGLLYVFSQPAEVRPDMLVILLIIVFLGGIMLLILGFILTLVTTLSVGFNSLPKLIGVQQTTYRQHPIQGVRQSGRNAVQMTVLSLWGVMLTATLVVGLFLGFGVGINVGLVVGLSFGLVYGLSNGMSYGGATVIRHYTLRWFLARGNILPYPFWNKRLIAYLDAMHERMILRRVGGGWIFIHRSLLEYFASLADASSD